MESMYVRRELMKHNLRFAMRRRTQTMLSTRQVGALRVRLGAALAMCVALGTASALLLTPQAAFAQAAEPSEAEIEQARARFAEGIAHADAAEWELAAAAFHEVMSVVVSPPVLFNLAHALVELNQFDEADELIDALLADSETDRDMRRRAAQLRTRMDRHGAGLTITARGLPEGSVVLLDGRPIAAERLGQRLRVSQGTHRVRVTSSGQEIAAEEIYTARRSRESVTVAPDPARMAAIRQEAEAAAQAEAERAERQAAMSAAERAEAERIAAERARIRAAHEQGEMLDSESPLAVRRAALQAERERQAEEERLEAERAATAPSEAVPLHKNWRFWTVVGSVAVLAIGVGVAVAVTSEDTPNRGVLGNFSPGRVEF